MRKRVLWLGLVALAIAGAAPPAGKISSAEPFQLRGVTMPVAGIPYWPVVIGDEFVTGKSAATVTFRDGSRVALAPNSKAVLELKDRKTLLRLRQGAMTYRLKSRSDVAVSALGLPLVPGEYSDGSISVYQNAAYLIFDPRAAATDPAGVVTMNPFNLGYLNGLRLYDPPALVGPGGQPSQTPPVPPGSLTPPDTGHLPSISPFR